jgi:peptide/nickel transport system permease protein
MSSSTLTTTQEKPKPSANGLGARFFKSIRGSKKMIFGLGIMLVLAIVAAFAPFFAPPVGDCLRDITGSKEQPANFTQKVQLMFLTPRTCLQMPKLSLSIEPTPPSAVSPFGTVNGYDIRYGVVWGLRSAFGLGLLVTFISLAIGVVVGVASGYFGGWVDNLVMRFTDVIFAFPSVVLTLVLIAFLGASLLNVAISFVIVGWASYARLVRAEVLRTKQLEYVEASRALGVGGFRIMMAHIFPNVIKPLLVIAAIDMASVPLLFSGLSYLGISTPPGYADFGQLIDNGQQWVLGRSGEPFAYWFVNVFPGIAIFAYTLAWNFIGEAVQDGVDVRSK